MIVASLLLLATTVAHAQVINGSGNGNNNSGLGSGNGNGNGNGNGSNNTTSTSASAGSNNTTSTSASAGGSAVTLNNNRRNAPAITAPSLAAAGIETCLGSNSVGGAGPGFGVTIAGTTTDRGCNPRLYSRTLYSMGHKLAATQILCNDPDVAAALALEGVRCLVGPAAEAAARGLANARAEAEAPPVAGWRDVCSAAVNGHLWPSSISVWCHSKLMQYSNSVLFGCLAASARTFGVGTGRVTA